MRGKDTLVVTSSSVEAGGCFSDRCAHRRVTGGKNRSPHVRWTAGPAGTASYAITIIDRHPVANNWVHWCVLNIPPEVTEIPEGAAANLGSLPTGSLELGNTFGEQGYGGPAPPRGTGPHTYEITVHALALSVTERITDFSKAARIIEENSLASGTCAGTYER